jgi:hypothetical protein
LKKNLHKKDWWSGSRYRPGVQTPVPQKIKNKKKKEKKKAMVMGNDNRPLFRKNCGLTRAEYPAHLE